MMNMSKFKTSYPKLFVEIEKPTKEEVDSYYKDKIKTSSMADDGVRVFKRATILSTYNEETAPLGSRWIIGETLGMKVNYFGNAVTIIEERDLYAKIED